MQDPLTFILKAQKEICMLESLTFLLDWDEQTNMPRGAIIGRSEQMKYVNGLIHDKLASPEMAQALSSFDPNTISERDAIVIDELQKRVRRSKIIPKKFQSELSETTILSQGVWKEARKANDFQKFLPYLEKIIISIAAGNSICINRFDLALILASDSFILSRVENSGSIALLRPLASMRTRGNSLAP